MTVNHVITRCPKLAILKEKILPNRTEVQEQLFGNLELTWSSSASHFKVFTPPPHAANLTVPLMKNHTFYYRYTLYIRDLHVASGSDNVAR
jgi:hypothetical protein